MYLQDKHSTTPSELQSEETEEAIFCGTEDINWKMNAMLFTQVPCPITSTFYPGSNLLGLLDHTFAEYLFLYDAHGKTPLCRSHQVTLDYRQAKHVLYTQQLIVADTTFCVPRSFSYTHQVSDCHSNLVTTPASSIDLISKSVHYLSLPFLCRIFLILDKLKIEMTKDSLHHAAKNGEHSCVENFHGDNLNPHNINKLSCTHQSIQEIQHLPHPEHCLIFVGPEHQSSKIYHAFSSFVKTTFNNEKILQSSLKAAALPTAKLTGGRLTRLAPVDGG